MKARRGADGARVPGRMRPEDRATFRVRTALILGTLLLLAAGAAPAGGQETEPPPPLEERPIEFPGFEELALDNGLRVVVLSYGMQPVVSARLYARGGQAAEPVELAGLASFAATVLTRGTETRSANDISAAIEGVGGSLDAAAGQDFFSVSTTVLRDHLETGFELLGDVVRHATFPEDEVELARRQALSSLQAELGQPQAVAQRRFGAVVYGETHPYGVEATPETVEAITRDDLVGYRDRVLAAEGALLLVAGAVSHDEVESLARRHLADWSGSPAVEAEPPGAPEPDETRIHLVHRPGSVQSVIAIGHPSLPPGHPDRFALTVMNRVLGGGSDARLFQILREEKGWTYGAYSQLTRPAGPGVFRATAEVRTEVTDSAVVEVLDQMRRLRNEPVPSEELDGARDYLAGSFPLRLETADQVASQLATTLLLDLPLEDLTRYPERVRAVNADDVQRAAREHLHPDRSAVVVVGDAPRLLEALEAVAPVRLVDIEGQPLDREEVLAGAAPGEWDASRLEEGVRRYEVYIQGSPMGSAEYRLERDGADWVSTSIISAASVQESRVRFSADDLTPRALQMESGQGAMGLAADLVVEDGHVRGRVELPEQLGGDREYDEDLAPGTLLPGMDEYALALSELEEGARITVPVLDLVAGGVSAMEARVTGREEIEVPAGTFDTWRVEISGGDDPAILYLRAEAPHILVRQEYQSQPVRLDLMGVGR